MAGVWRYSEISGAGSGVASMAVFRAGLSISLVLVGFQAVFSAVFHFFRGAIKGSVPAGRMNIGRLFGRI